MCVYNTFAAINISCRVVIDGCCFWMSGQNKCVATAECLLPNLISFGWYGTDFWSFDKWFTAPPYDTKHQLWISDIFHIWLLPYCIFLGHAQGNELAYSYLLKEYWLVYTRSAHAAAKAWILQMIISRKIIYPLRLKWHTFLDHGLLHNLKHEWSDNHCPWLLGPPTLRPLSGKIQFPWPNNEWIQGQYLQASC